MCWPLLMQNETEGRIARCLKKNTVSVCPVCSNFLAKKFDNGDVIGKLIFRYLSVCSSYFFPYFSIFNFWQLDLSSTVKYNTSNYASRKFEGDQIGNSQRLMLSCIFSVKFGYSFDKWSKMDCSVNIVNEYYKKLQNVCTNNTAKKVDKSFGN